MHVAKMYDLTVILKAFALSHLSSLLVDIFSFFPVQI